MIAVAKKLMFFLPFLGGLVIYQVSADGTRRTTLSNNQESPTQSSSSQQSRSSQGDSIPPSEETESLERQREESVVENTAEQGNHANVYQAPRITLDKPVYLENEPITVSFSVGSPNDSYYASSMAPSRENDWNYPNWSIGLFMRDADPQGGRLAPIVGIKLCGELECDPNVLAYPSYTSSFTFDLSGDYADAMQGKWPLLVGDYGTGFDAFVLDGNGAAAIGPLEFNIRSKDDEDYVAPRHKQPQSTSPITHSEPPAKVGSTTNKKEKKQKQEVPKKKHGLLTYNHAATKKSSTKHTASVASNSNIVTSNGLSGGVTSSMASSATPSDFAVNTQEVESSISSEKSKYHKEDPISIIFSVGSDVTSDYQDADLSQWKIGVFRRMDTPQGGTLEPILSIPLCREGSCHNNSVNIASGIVVFSEDSVESMKGNWPIDSYDYGTGFDVYILDEDGSDVVGPAMFDMLMDDSY